MPGGSRSLTYRAVFRFDGFVSRPKLQTQTNHGRLPSVVGYIKGKSAIHVARHFLRRERNYAGQRIWARGFFVDTVGRDTETIRKYIAEQEMEDRRLDQLEMPEITRE